MNFKLYKVILFRILGGKIMEFSKRGVPRKILDTPGKKGSNVLPLCPDGLDSCVTGVRIGKQISSKKFILDFKIRYFISKV